MNNKTNTIKYPNRLKEFRVKLNLKQKDVAIRLNLSVSNQDRISKWENGQSVPSIDNLFKICRVYGITPHEAYPLL